MTDEADSLETPLQTDTHGLRISVDPEPFSFRLLVMAAFIFGTIAGYIVLSMMTSEGTCNILALFGGFGFGGALMYLTERFAKPRWRSNRFVLASPESVQVVYRGQPKREIDTTQQVNVLTWHFRVQRRTRVPKGWYMVGLSLEQDDAYLPAYTLISPEQFETLPHAAQYLSLVSRKELERLSDTSNLRKAGLQRRLHTAEFARTIEGVEMHYDDFVQYVAWLKDTFPNWMP